MTAKAAGHKLIHAGATPDGFLESLDSEFAKFSESSFLAVSKGDLILVPCKGTQYTPIVKERLWHNGFLVVYIDIFH